MRSCWFCHNRAGNIPRPDRSEGLCERCREKLADFRDRLRTPERRR